jgi:phage terminase small subunit
MSRPARYELTIGEERFCEAFESNGGNADAAHHEAFGYSYGKNGSSNASLILSRPAVILRIDEIRRRISERLEVDRNRVADELGEIAFANIADYLDFDSERITIKELRKLTRRKSRAIKTVRQRTSKDGETVIELELHDKLQAIEKLAKVLGYYSDVTLQQVNQYVVRAPAAVESSETWEHQAQALLEAPQAPIEPDKS